MEVLCEVDRPRIEALRARDEFFWLDLDRPSQDVLDAAGALLGLHPLALEDTREFNQRAKVDRYPDAVLLVYWTARAADDGVGLEQVEVHLHISGGLPVHGPPRALRGARRAARDARARRHRGRGLHRLPRARRADGRAVPGRRPPGDAHRRARGARAAAHRPSPARRRSTGSSRRCRCCCAASCRSATSSARRPRRSCTLPGLTRGSREYLRDIGDHLAQVTSELYRQADDLGGAHLHVLQREPEPAQPARDAADRARLRSSSSGRWSRASSARTSAG